MTFKEISAWISAIVIVVLYGYYLSEAPDAATSSAALALFLKVAIAAIIVESVLQAIASGYHRPEKTDERDKLISAKASRNSSYVLMTGIVICNIQLLMPVERVAEIAQMPAATIAVHILILTAAAGELLRFASQIVYYRKGA